MESPNTRLAGINASKKGGRFAQLLLAGIVCAVLPTPVQADGGTLRLSEQRHGYRISVFTSPSPWRAGPVDVSVLVQNVETGDPLADVDVAVAVSSLDRPGRSIAERAVAGSATNKLFYSAELELPSSGRWRIEVTVAGPQGTTTSSCELEAGEPLPPWLGLAPLIGWPAIVIALFVVHQCLVRRHGRGCAHGSIRSSVASLG
jgi:hypothetical protein